MNIDFPKTIIDVYNAATHDETLLIEYFVIKAKEANKVSYGYDFFFRECKNRVDSLKKSIELQNKQHIRECEQMKCSPFQDIDCFAATFRNDNTKFYYKDLNKIEQAIIQAEQKLIPEQKQQQQIQLPDEVLQWLQKNGFIENATVKPLKWLKTKQLARELLTHSKIKDSLTVAEIERQAPTLFIDKNNNPLTLAKNKKIPSTDSDNLSNYLATL